MSDVTVQFQHFHGCPNGPTLLKRLREAVSRCRREVKLEETLVESMEKAVEVNFRGSPTLLIDGEDIAGMPQPSRPLLNCRMYPQGLPTVEQILARLEGQR